MVSQNRSFGDGILVFSKLSLTGYFASWIVKLVINSALWCWLWLQASSQEPVFGRSGRKIWHTLGILTMYSTCTALVHCCVGSALVRFAVAASLLRCLAESCYGVHVSDIVWPLAELANQHCALAITLKGSKESREKKRPRAPLWGLGDRSAAWLNIWDFVVDNLIGLLLAPPSVLSAGSPRLWRLQGPSRRAVPLAECGMK